MGRLVLTFKKGEQIILNGDIVLEISQIKGKTIRLSILAPKKIPVSHIRNSVKSESIPQQRLVAIRAGEP